MAPSHTGRVHGCAGFTHAVIKQSPFRLHVTDWLHIIPCIGIVSAVHLALILASRTCSTQFSNLHIYISVSRALSPGEGSKAPAIGESDHFPFRHCLCRLPVGRGRLAMKTGLKLK